MAQRQLQFMSVILPDSGSRKKMPELKFIKIYESAVEEARLVVWEYDISRHAFIHDV